MVQKYRSAAPQYIYKINTLFKQNKLQHNVTLIIIDIVVRQNRTGQDRISQLLNYVAPQSERL